jgi:hypothetical protein
MHDSGKAANNELFWRQVQKAFVTKSTGSLEQYDRFNFADDEVFCKRDIIVNPGIVVNHNWKKL